MARSRPKAVSGKQVSRRQFVKSAAVGAAALTWAAPAVVRGQNLNDKLNIAVIGTGGRGGSNLQSVESENIVALCDVNEYNLSSAASRHPVRAKRPTSGNCLIMPTNLTPLSSARANTRMRLRPCRPYNWASTSIAKSRSPTISGRPG